MGERDGRGMKGWVERGEGKVLVSQRSERFSHVNFLMFPRPVRETTSSGGTKYLGRPEIELADDARREKRLEVRAVRNSSFRCIFSPKRTDSYDSVGCCERRKEI